MAGIEKFLAKRLKLKVNKAKSAVAKPSARKFLGFSFTGGREPRRRIAPQAIARLKARVRELTRRTRGRSLAQTSKELSTYLVGWRGYFGFCQTPSVLRALDDWIRRRLRAIAWKQWRRGRTRFAELRHRGVGRDLAAQTAGSPHGPWRWQRAPRSTWPCQSSSSGHSVWLPSRPRPLNPSNRRIRTRTSGGVGGAEPRGSPLSRLRVVIVREGGRSSTPPALDSISDAGDYWIPAFAGMTAGYDGPYCAASSASPSAG